MSVRLPPPIVRDRHAYTRSREPWIIAECKTAYGKMINYLSGGGLKTFGRTVRQEEIRSSQLRFFRVFLVFVAVWLYFLIF